MKLKGSGLGLWVVASLIGSVQAESLPSEQAYFEDLAVAISASRLSQPISETPNAVTVLDQQTIRAAGVRRVTDLFRLVPGMYVGYELGHNPIVAYRGATDAYARRMQVLIDGRTVYLPPYGQVDWPELPLEIDDIERVEIIRGPAAASHGSNSVQGVISIFTRQALSQDASLRVMRGEQGVAEQSVSLGKHLSQGYWRATLATRSDNGFDGLINNIDQEIEINDNYGIKLANVRAGWQPNNQDHFDLQLGYSQSRSQDGNRFLPRGHTDTLRDAMTDYGFVQVNWLRSFAADNDLQLNYYFINRSNQDFRPHAGTPFWIRDSVDVERHELALQHSLTWSTDNRLVWGASYRDDQVASPHDLLEPLHWHEYHFFAHDEWRLNNKSLLNIGGMVEKNAQDKWRFSPRTSYHYHITPQHSIRAGVSVAYRNPEMMEEKALRRYSLQNGWQTGEFTARGGLSPERMVAREIGYLAQLDHRGSTLDLRAYSDKINDIIWIDPILSPQRTNNFKPIFSARYSGLEAVINYHFTPQTALLFNYAYQRVNATVAQPLTEARLQAVHQQYVARYRKTVPLHSGSILLSHQWGEGWLASGGYYWRDPVQVLDVATEQTRSQRLDLQLAKQWQVGQFKGDLALIVENAFNDAYLDYNDDIAHRRRSYVNLKVAF